MPVQALLSKSDFKTGLSCPAKLYYKKMAFPTALDGNEYMEMLAEGGYMIGYLAQLLYPEGIEIKGNLHHAAEETNRQLKKENVTLFEPVVFSGGLMVQPDILVKRGRKLKLIEVKSKSFNSVELQLARKNHKKYFVKEFAEYLYDVAYQKMVLQSAFPGMELECELLMPDKAKNAEMDGMVGMFELLRAPAAVGFKKPLVNFTGPPADLELLQKHHTLDWVNIDEEINPLLTESKQKALLYLKAIQRGEKLPAPIGINCKDCEYTAKNPETNESGFESCWGELGRANPHILELVQLGNINKRGNIINAMIKQGKTSLYDVPLEALSKPDGSSYYNNRPLYQVREKKEFMLEGFAEVVNAVQYPSFFIDFETSQMALPYHKGMRCFENVIFQYSCHKIAISGADPVHYEWINMENAFPNHEFARNLMSVLGNRGTIFIWSKYEITQFRNILRTLIARDEDPELRIWLGRLLLDFETDGGRFIDLNDVAGRYYFHPVMGGRTSIKVTLPAVLQATRSEKIKRWLLSKGLLAVEADGSLQNPYKLLPPIPILDQDFQINVKDGSGAMRAYQEMLYGINKHDPEISEVYRKSLLDYCCLDTLAMVIIWEHWNGL
jgi:hypothetical protein